MRRRRVCSILHQTLEILFRFLSSFRLLRQFCFHNSLLEERSRKIQQNPNFVASAEKSISLIFFVHIHVPLGNNLDVNYSRKKSFLFVRKKNRILVSEVGVSERPNCSTLLAFANKDGKTWTLSKTKNNNNHLFSFIR